MATMTYGTYVNNKGGDKNGVYRLQEDGTMIYIPNTGKGSAGTGSTLNVPTGNVAGGAAGYNGAVETYTPPAADSTPTGTVKADTPMLDTPVVENPTTEQPTGNYYTNMLAGLDDAYQKALARAEDIRKQYEGIAQTERDRLYKNAELAKDKAVVDASTARKKASATYGNNAEALRRMGLTGSGYSEYLEGKAYALERGDVQAANAAELLAKRQADEGYLDTITQGTAAASQLVTEAENALTSGKLQLESQLKEDEDKTASNYLKLLDAANTGNYTEEAIRAAAAVLKITDESQIAAIVNAATTANTKKTETEKKEDNAAFDETLSYVTGTETNERIQDSDYTPEQKEELTAARDKAHLDLIPSTVKASGAQATFDALDDAKENDLLSEDGYKAGYFSTFLEMIDLDGDVYNNAGVIEAQINNAEKQGKLTAADANSLREYVTIKSVRTVDATLGNAATTYAEKMIPTTSSVPIGVLDAFLFAKAGTNQYTRLDIQNSAVPESSNEGHALASIDAQSGQIAKIGDKYYLYVSYKGKEPAWYKVNGIGGSNKKFDELFDALVASGGGVTRPKHATDEKNKD